MWETEVFLEGRKEEVGIVLILLFLVDTVTEDEDSEDISCEKKVIDGTVTSVDGKEFCYNVVFTATLGDLERIYYVNYVNVQG